MFAKPALAIVTVLTLTTSAFAEDAAAKHGGGDSQIVGELVKQVFELQDRLSKLESGVQVGFNEVHRVPVGSAQNYTPARGGGSNSMAMNSYCPPDQVMVGLEVVVGGTCHGQCDPDGGTLHKYRIVCAPRFAK